MTVIVPRNVNCNKGLIATQAKPVCIILHSIKEIASDECKTLNDPGCTLATFPQSREIHLCTKKEEKAVCKMLERAGIITKSMSPWASPIVIVPKKSQPGEPPKKRLCIDFRKNQ